MNYYMNSEKLPVFQTDQDQIWKPAQFHVQILIGISLLVIICWMYIITRLYFALVTARGPFIPGYGFVPFFILIAAYPIIYLVNQIFTVIKAEKLGINPGLDPYYGFCIVGPDSLTKEEIELGAVGAMDYACHHEQLSDTNSTGAAIISMTYYSVYALFALVLFFFTQQAGKFRDVVANRDSIFVTTVIKYSLILALILMGSEIVGGYYYLSTILNYFFLDILQLVGALMMMLISHILYRLTFLYK